MIKIITTLPKTEFDTMGKKLFESWEKYHSNKMKMIVFLNKNDQLPEKTYEDIEFHHIKNPEYYKFLEKYSNIPENRGILPDGRYEYRLDGVRFSHKVYAIYEGLSYLGKDDELYIWWDSDAYFTDKVTPQIIKTNLGPFNWVAAYLGRKDWDHTETGFIAFNLLNNETRNFINDLVGVYNSGELFKLNRGRTDCHVFDLIREFYATEKKQNFKNISENASGNDVWHQTFLGKFSVHLKGFEAKINNKMISRNYIEDISKNNTMNQNQNMFISDAQKDIGFMERYNQLYKFLEAFRFRIITEIGVSKGDRAEEMVRTVFKYCDRCIYFGFDLFEDLDEETSKSEFNGKPKSSYSEVFNRLRNLQKEFPGFFFALYKGNTRETIPENIDKVIELSNDEGIVVNVKPSMSEFVFIDGGHSIETISSDYENFKNCNLVILDDYYEKDENGRIPDISKFGCNFLLQKYSDLKVLPIADRVVGGGLVKFVLGGKFAKNIIIKVDENQKNNQISRAAGNIRNDNVSVGGKPLQIQTKNSIPDEKLQEQVEYNCKMMIKHNIPEVYSCKIHDTWAYMVAGAETYKKLKYMKMIEEAIHDRSKGLVFASKTSHDYLIDNGLVPWACILLDPRPHVIKSFKPHKDVLYFVASQCHQSVIDTLIENNCKIQVYHAAVAAGEDKVVKKYFPKGTMITGGSTSQVRGIVMLMRMGFYRFKLFGLDSSYISKPEKVHGINQEKKAIEVEINLKDSGKKLGKFWTDPEMLAQLNDLEHILRVYPHLEIDCQSEGIFGALYREDWEKNKFDFHEIYRDKM